MSDKDKILNLPVSTIKRTVLFFEPFGEGHENYFSDKVENKLLADYNFNFDYETQGKIYKFFHIDTGVRVHNTAEMLLRTTFRITYGGELLALFVPAVITPMVNAAWKGCFSAFKQQCQENGIDFTSELPAPNIDFAADMIERYTSRRADDDANVKLTSQQFLSFTYGTKTALLLNGTFMVLEEVLFLNKGFDRKCNRAVFPVPPPVYQTLKLKCLDLENGKIQFDLLYSVHFLLCLDCALALLLGDHAELLSAPLAEKGFTKKKETEYLEFAGGYLKSVLDSLAKSGAHLTNLENRPDWNSFLKRK